MVGMKYTQHMVCTSYIIHKREVRRCSIMVGCRHRRECWRSHLDQLMGLPIVAWSSVRLQEYCITPRRWPPFGHGGVSTLIQNSRQKVSGSETTSLVRESSTPLRRHREQPCRVKGVEVSASSGLKVSLPSRCTRVSQPTNVSRDAVFPVLLSRDH